MEGIIVKGIAGFYYVKAEDTVYQCKARGVFKKQGITPAVGDRVTIRMAEEGSDAVIEAIHERKNSFIRPPIANVDCFVVVLAAANPKPNLTITDKFLVMAEKSHTDIILCINKSDLVSREELDAIKEIYRDLYPVVCVSGKEGIGLDELKQRLEGKISALAGPSGVGKSTLLNKLAPHALAETGDISGKTKRGKHTTRHSELFEMGENAMIFDTPGFTSFEILDADEEELQYFYPEMEALLGTCKYDNCRHKKEPACAIRDAAEDGRIHPSRYASYLAQLEEIQQKIDINKEKNTNERKERDK